MPKIILIVGRKKSGKTTLVKARFGTLKNFFVVDVHNEYKELPVSNTPKPGARAITNDVEGIIEQVARSRGLTFCIEDATIWLNQRTSDVHLKNLVISCRHNKNVLVLLFHSLNRIPLFILEQADFLYLFATKDTKQTWQKIDDPDIKEAFEAIKEENKPHNYKAIRL